MMINLDIFAPFIFGVDTFKFTDLIIAHKNKSIFNIKNNNNNITKRDMVQFGDNILRKTLLVKIMKKMREK